MKIKTTQASGPSGSIITTNIYGIALKETTIIKEAEGLVRINILSDREEAISEAFEMKISENDDKKISS